MRIIAFIMLVLALLSTKAQLDLRSADSLGVWLKTSQSSLEMDLFPGGPCGIIETGPLPNPPVYCKCEKRTILESNDCMNRRILKLVRKEANIPAVLADSTFHAKVYVQFSLDTLANAFNIRILRGATTYLPENLKPMAHLLDEECIRLIKLLQFCKPAAVDGKPVPISLSIPFTFSNP